MNPIAKILGKILGWFCTQQYNLHQWQGARMLQKAIATMLDDHSPYKVFASPEIPQKVFPVYLLSAPLDLMSGGGPTYRHVEILRREGDVINAIVINLAAAALGDDVLRAIVLRETSLILEGGIEDHNRANSITLEYKHDAYAAEKGYGVHLLKLFRAMQKEEYFPTKLLKVAHEQYMQLRIQHLIKAIGY